MSQPRRTRTALILCDGAPRRRLNRATIVRVRVMIRDPKQFLDDLSEAISDGRPVDWNGVEVNDSSTRELVEQLRVLADIAQLHRETLPEPSDGHITTPELLAEAVGGTWGRLILRRIIGRGGRGLVYRAWDPQLEREVALKVIAEAPDDLASDVIAEARQLARVQHPNVATIYGADRIDGTTGLWMELIEGRTLERMLREDGRFSAREAALVGVDVCAALAAVHKAGVLHRDVKAQNVMRDRHGRIVLMDFGTSRLADESPSDVFVHDGVGTPMYMAPELWQGGQASVRSDVYAVGVLLYRLVTGGLPVDARSIDDLKRAHRDGAIRRLSDERSDLPLAFIHIVERAMDPDPSRRYASAGALEMALAAFLAPVATEARTSGPRRWWPAAILSLAAVAAIGVLAASMLGAWSRPPGSAPANVEVRFPIYPLPPDEIESMAMAPGGRMLAFTSAGQLWLRSFDRMEPRRIPDTQGAHDPFWSPDGEYVAYFRGRSLWRVRASGGGPEQIAPARRPSTGSWGPNGLLLYSTNLGRELVTVPAAGGTPTIVRRDVPGRRVRLWWPSFLPSGQGFVYSAVDATTGKRAVYVGRLDRPAEDDRLLLDVESNVLVAGEYLYFTRLGQLLRQRYDEAAAALQGTAQVLADNVRVNPYNNGFADIAASPGGALAYMSGAQQARQLQLVDADGRVLQELGDPGEYRDIALSHDGARLAYEQIDQEAGTRDIWVHDLTSGVRLRVTHHPADETSPIWSPDDRTLYFLSMRDQQTRLFRRIVDHSAPEEPVLSFDVPVRPSAVSRDDGMLFYEQLDQENGWDLWMRPLDGGPPQQYLATGNNDHEAVPSPDGRFIAYSSPDADGRQVYVMRRDGSDWRARVSGDYGREPLWSADGTQLFYHGKDRQLMVASLDVSGDVPVVRSRRRLFELRFRGYDLRYHYAVLPDSRRFILNAPVPGTFALPATVVVR